MKEEMVMPGLGHKNYIWSRELDEKLLSEIAKGKNLIQLTISMGMGKPKINKRLKDMGFDGLVDARNVMTQ
jgi:hypothetical protein